MQGVGVELESGRLTIASALTSGTTTAPIRRTASYKRPPLHSLGTLLVGVGRVHPWVKGRDTCPLTCVSILPSGRPTGMSCPWSHDVLGNTRHKVQPCLLPVSEDRFFYSLLSFFLTRGEVEHFLAHLLKGSLSLRTACCVLVVFPEAPALPPLILLLPSMTKAPLSDTFLPICRISLHFVHTGVYSI